jgi:hypothetical protein
MVSVADLSRVCTSCDEIKYKGVDVGLSEPLRL